jgi:hypothetical protein
MAFSIKLRGLNLDLVAMDQKLLSFFPFDFAIRFMIGFQPRLRPGSLPAWLQATKKDE